MDTSETLEKKRGRTERRTPYITKNIDWLYGKEKWSNLKSIGAICSRVTHKGKSVTTGHFYISSRAMSARLEWSVETMHRLLDVHFSEDACRVIDKNLQRNLNLFRKVALNYVKLYKEKHRQKSTLSHIMLDCLINPLNLKMILSEN